MTGREAAARGGDRRRLAVSLAVALGLYGLLLLVTLGAHWPPPPRSESSEALAVELVGNQAPPVAGVSLPAAQAPGVPAARERPSRPVGNPFALPQSILDQLRGGNVEAASSGAFEKAASEPPEASSGAASVAQASGPGAQTFPAPPLAPSAPAEQSEGSSYNATRPESPSPQASARSFFDAGSLARLNEIGPGGEASSTADGGGPSAPAANEGSSGGGSEIQWTGSDRRLVAYRPGPPDLSAWYGVLPPKAELRIVFQVQPSGNVEALSISPSLGYPSLDNALKNWMGRWRFQPVSSGTATGVLPYEIKANTAG